MIMTKLTTFAQVRELKGWHAECFCAALLSRMVPNYTLFAELTEQESPTLLSNVLSLIWERLSSPKSKINFSLQREKVEEAAPDIAAFDMFGVYPANDACMAMVAALNLIAGDDDQGAVVVSKLSQGGVEASLLMSENLTEEEIKTHALMQFEIEVQQALLALIKDAPPNKDTARKARELAGEAQITNIGVELE
ncbi:DUF416 family protein [Alteromonas sediminis]|uniref:DUF416 family protein n=1 Tax=Alteromonas sediminis TaxID=2259342 RepID=A0A3N5XWP3_9ALTE|nr:YjaG family protein [Alteromonas sediminis]RPJ64830.1 DUF416 family protein [Alteromonas sediminis]